MDDAESRAEDEDLARLVRERIAAGPSRPLTELAAELGIDLDELGAGGQRSSAMDVREVVRLLNDTLGPTLVAALSGSHDPEIAQRWALEDGPEPDAGAVKRLLLAHKAWTLVSNSEGDDVARSWFVGENPCLGDGSPSSCA